jgi:hypothetical protein
MKFRSQTATQNSGLARKAEPARARTANRQCQPGLAVRSDWFQNSWSAGGEPELRGINPAEACPA